MNVKEKVECLEQLKHLRREVDALSQRIAELELAARGGVSRITGLPGSVKRWDRVGDCAVKLADLSARLEARRQRCMDMLGALYAFIDGIGDSLTRQVMTMRYIDGKSWQSIATALGETDEQFPRRLHNRFLNAVDDAYFAPFDENDEGYDEKDGAFDGNDGSGVLQ